MYEHPNQLHLPKIFAWPFGVWLVVQTPSSSRFGPVDQRDLACNAPIRFLGSRGEVYGGTLWSLLYALGKTASMAEEESEVELDRLKEELETLLVANACDEHGHISKSYCAKFCKVGYELLSRITNTVTPVVVVPKELAERATS